MSASRGVLPDCSFSCVADVVEGIVIGITHGADCPAIASWSWPIPPEHAGPCACRRAPGCEHFTDHSPIGCSVIPADLAERMVDGLAMSSGRVRTASLAEEAEEILEDLSAVNRRAKVVAAEQRELYG